jgi:hypothetical protein
VALQPQNYQILFGDIHNHNAHGYGQGSIERSLEIARTHLDFFAFTGHAQWHDMHAMEGGREAHWLKGFERLRETWPRVQAVIADANRDSEFGAFLGFEWHSSGFGDQCVVFPEDFRPLHYADSVEELRRFCISERALMIPHHLAYPRGMRGVNWDVFNEDCTPVVEIYSEHGSSEDDRGAYPMFSHSMGGRETVNTVRAALERGLRFGFVGSSDNHAGFPGAYGEGLMGALCTELTRPAILEAIRNRRTYALTGDRIEVDFRIEGAVMGSTIRARTEVAVEYEVRGRDEIDVVEIIQDGSVRHRSFASDQTPDDALQGPVQVRFEWGWGPWGALALQRICDWEFEITTSDARILRVFPCLQSGPFDEARRHRFVQDGDHRLKVLSYTSRREAYRENPNQSVVLEIAGNADAQVRVRTTKPHVAETSVSLGELLQASRNLRTGPFPQESYQWHRIVPLAASHVRDSCSLPIPAAPSHVYLRARQKNGHTAWTSPVFIN